MQEPLDINIVVGLALFFIAIMELVTTRFFMPYAVRKAAEKTNKPANADKVRILTRIHYGMAFVAFMAGAYILNFKPLTGQ